MDTTRYNTHSFRIGRTTNMMLEGYSEAQIKVAGRWISNAFIRYSRPSILTFWSLGRDTPMRYLSLLVLWRLSVAESRHRDRLFWRRICSKFLGSREKLSRIFLVQIIITYVTRYRENGNCVIRIAWSQIILLTDGFVCFLYGNHVFPACHRVCRSRSDIGQINNG